jgi:hypothetical protein
MRLLYTTSDEELGWTNDIIHDKDVPPYAILSHTWGKQEVVFDDLKSLDSAKNIDAETETSWNKIRFCAQRAKRDNLTHFWVDTCCIDKANNTELSEAINSMFRWYQNAEKCYVFLSDVEDQSLEGSGELRRRWKAAFRNSRWFTRGWTLQELLAPKSVEFFSKEGIRLGDKKSLKDTIHEATGIPIQALLESQLSDFSVAERFSWTIKRETTREEDGAYCLFGIFGVHLPLIYGEGKEKALKRLKKGIQEASEDIASASVTNATTRTQSQEEWLSKIQRWLPAPDPSINYEKALKQRQHDTGLWFLEGELYASWQRDPASSLWLYGIPGCGKTVLSSTILQDLLRHCDSNPEHIVIYFYFDFNNSEKQDVVRMLRSLVYQLSWQAAEVPASLRALFSSCKDGKRQPPLDALLQAVRQIIQQLPQVYIMLDALDECTERTELMETLETIAGWKLLNMHLLVTSRRERDIESSLKGFVDLQNGICLQVEVVDKDIEQYVRQRLSDDKGLNKWGKDIALRHEIESALMKGSKGMSVQPDKFLDIRR